MDDDAKKIKKLLSDFRVGYKEALKSEYNHTEKAMYGSISLHILAIADAIGHTLLCMEKDARKKKHNENYRS